MEQISNCKKNIRFAIAVIFYNPDSAVLKRVEKYSERFEKCLIVDNSDIDKLSSVDMNSNIEYRWMGENKGLSIALEYAYKWAYKNQVHYLLTMDQDTEYLDSEIMKMMIFIQNNPGAAIYCANWRKIYWNRKMTEEKFGPLFLSTNEVREVKFSMTSGSWTDVNKVMEILPLENYFIGYVDTDISFQLKSKGYRIICVGNSLIKQQIGNKVVGSHINMFFRKVLHTKERYYYMSRNNLYLTEKYAYNKIIKLFLRKNRVRLFLNILFFETDKLEKYRYWLKGKNGYKKKELGILDI